MNVVQCNLSHNEKKGTLRGMHFQTAPYEESKIVVCIKGSIYDVVLDLRESSPTFMKWESFELSEKNKRAVFIPKGCAHGFQTLENDTDVFYYMDQIYSAEHASGINYGDERFGITWPDVKNIIISDKDRAW